MNSKHYRTEVDTPGDFDDLPELATFTIDRETALRIAELSAIARDKRVYMLEEFDTRATYFQFDPTKNHELAKMEGPDNEVSTDCDCLNVTETEFWFTAYVNDTTIRLMTARQSVSELLAHFGICETASSDHVEAARASAPRTLEVFAGYVGHEGTILRVDFEAPAGCSSAEKDAAFVAALAQIADVNYVAIGDMPV